MKSIKILRVTSILIIFVLVALFSTANYVNFKNVELLGSNSIPVIINYGIILFLISSILGTYYIYKVVSGKGKKIMDVNEKVKLYNKFHLIRLISIGLSGLGTIVILFLDYNKQYFYLFLIAVVFLFFNYPSESKFENDFFEKDE